MAYEQRDSGSHVMVCDKCHHDMMSPTKDDLLEDLALAGWTPVGKGPDGKECFVCNHCAKEAATKSPMQQMFGDNITVQAPGPVHKGDPFSDDEGNVVGHYEADAGQGDEVGVKLDDPEPEPQPSVIESFDAMMEGTDADDDRLGRVSAVAPVGGPAVSDSGGGVAHGAGQGRPHTVSGSGDSPVAASTDGSPDGTAASGAPRRGARPDHRSGPALDADALLATANIFDNLDTSWDPDA